MALVQRDYILRMIEVVAAALARVLRRRQDGDAIGARQEIRLAIGEVLGPSASMAEFVDARTAADLLSDGRRIVLYASLLAEDAEILGDMGQAPPANAARKRAAELMLETRIRKLELPDEDNERIDAFLVGVDRAQLASRYH